VPPPEQGTLARIDTVTDWFAPSLSLFDPDRSWTIEPDVETVQLFPAGAVRGPADTSVQFVGSVTFPEPRPWLVRFVMVKENVVVEPAATEPGTAVALYGLDVVAADSAATQISDAASAADIVTMRPRRTTRLERCRI
jgi:hypothetical protein